MFLYNYFNPHFRKGSDGDLQSATNIIAISIHTSAREVTPFPLPDDRACRFQSTLPQGKWQDFHWLLSTLLYISIHTSAREVTEEAASLWDRTGISIHTSAREVTDITLTLPGIAGISIHTSAREVTRLMYCVPDQYWISIHTSAREVTEPFL